MPTESPRPDTDDASSSSSRRRLLAASAGVVVMGLAGCSNGDTSSPESPSPTAPETTDSPGAAPTRLASGDVVVYLRPPAPRTTHAESALVETSACTGDAVLATEGRASARTIGDAFATLGVDVRQVDTSSTCLARDTARLAFGQGTPLDALDWSGGSTPAGTPPPALVEALSSPPADGGVRVLVGGRGIFERATGVSLQPGESAVVAPSDDGFEVVGTGAPSAWVDGAVRQRAHGARYTIREGTAEETSVVRTRAATEGPTVLVVGGVHGDEVAGYRVANRLTDWSLAAGTVVVVPRANVPAIERGRRTADDGVDLNRQFPAGTPPNTPLARELYNVVVRHDPDVVIDCHSSQGIWGDGGFGQAIFDTGVAPLAERLDRLVASLNAAVIPESRQPAYAYQSVHSDGEPPGMFYTKIARDLGVPACLHEVTETDVAVSTQVAWTEAVLERLLDVYGVRPLGGAA